MTTDKWESVLKKTIYDAVEVQSEKVARSFLEFIISQEQKDPAETLDFMKRFLTAVVNKDEFMEMGEGLNFPGVCINTRNKNDNNE